jgi:NAD+ synthase (glutamine-hydrolysing)
LDLLVTCGTIYGEAVIEPIFVFRTFLDDLYCISSLILMVAHRLTTCVCIHKFFPMMMLIGASGYFLPLSGGADSSSVCALVGIMCDLVFKAVQDGDHTVLTDLKRIVGKTNDVGWTPKSPQDIASCVLHTCYMGTVNSSLATRTRAANLAIEVGTYHSSINIDAAVSAVITVFAAAFSRTPNFISNGGTLTEDLSLQNIQARLRMVFAYFLAQLLPWVRDRKGFLLVLGSANVDESLRGYMTKYDCSSADINPIGSISKGDINSFLRWAGNSMGFKTLIEIVDAPPTAELRPIVEKEGGGAEHSQTDEEDMGMSYSDLGVYGKLRKIHRCGPVSMFQRLTNQWSHLTPSAIAEKVKRFFYFYSVNRHKMTTLTPAYHAESYSPDDNR